MTKQKQERDAAIDRLLAGAMTQGAADATPGCLDAETLAAWSDNALSSSGRAAAEAHAADCARCQALLAVMAKTAPAPTAPASAWWMPSLRWLVPLTAAGAAVLVWTLVPPRATNVRQVTQVAESAAPEPPSLAQPPSPEPPSPTAPPAIDRERRAQAAPAAAKELELSRQSANSARADVQADKKSEAPRDANAVAEPPRQRAEVRLEKSQAAADQAAAPAAAAPAAPPVAGAAARTFAVGAPETVVVSSNPGVRWRILQGGAVQHSADGGATWQVQNTGVSETLTAGFSPSPSVCWLVGPSGIVLLSTDGRSWKRVASPDSAPLVAVSAADGETATVTTADRRQFVTADGGRTWTIARH